MNPSAPLIQIADDEVFMRRLLEATLKKGGYEVVQATTGLEALAVATTRKPQLIVMDVMMPGLDGVTVLRRLKEDEATQKIPVIILSSRGHSLTRVEAEKAGATLFLTKPFSPTDLLNAVKRILAGGVGAGEIGENLGGSNGQRLKGSEGAL